MGRAGKIILAEAGVGAVAYIIAYFVRQANLLTNCSASVGNIQPQSITASSVLLTADMTTTNTSDLNLTINSGALSCTVNGFPAGDIVIASSTDLPAQGSAVIPIIISFDTSSELKSIASIITTFNLNNLTVRIFGSLSVTSGVLFFNSFPIDFSFSVADILNRTKNGSSSSFTGAKKKTKK